LMPWCITTFPGTPNRLDQREGRVDRYGQKRDTVKVVLLYGADNPVDLTVLDVLIRKAHAIRHRLGVSVPVPVDSEQVIQAVVNSVLLRGPNQGRQLQLGFTDSSVSNFHAEWDKAAEREGKMRAFFSQHGIKANEVAQEIRELEPALGVPDDVQWFIANTIQRFNGELRSISGNKVFRLFPGDLAGQTLARDRKLKFPMEVAFKGIPPEGVTLIGRNHPVVASLCDAVIAKALTGGDNRFSRCGAIYSDAVKIRTAVIILRIRYMLEEKTRQFAEEVVVEAFQRNGQGNIEWSDKGLSLLRNLGRTANVPMEEQSRQVKWALDMLAGDWYHTVVAGRQQLLEKSHFRLRSVVKASPLKVNPYPPDILGCYVLIPSGGER
jgi:hypothetical protein